MNTALKFATTCGRGYRRAGDRTRKLYNAAVLQKVMVRDGHVTEPEYQEPFDVLFSVPRFEYGTAVGRRGLEPLTPCASCKCATNCANGPSAMTLPPGETPSEMPRPGPQAPIGLLNCPDAASQ